MKKHWKKIVSAVTLLSLVGVFFNFSSIKNWFEPEEALGAANLATFEVLGGGGGGGVIASSGGGGGGGGQYHKCVGQPLRQKSYTVIVGVGGTIDTTGETDSWITEYGSTSPLSLNADGGNGSSGVSAGSGGISGTTTGCAGTLTSYNGGTPGAGNGTGDAGGGGGGGAGWGGKGGNGAGATTAVGGGGGGGAGETGVGGDAGTPTAAGAAGTGGGGAGGAGGNGAVGAGGSGGIPATWHIVGGGGGGGGDNGLRGGACGAPGAGSGGGEVTGAGNGCRGEVRISYIDSEVNATGGTETTNGIYRIHTFTTSGTFTVTSMKSPTTVVQNSPADASTTPDTTPELKFTGTDSLSADLRYHVQVDSVNTFDSQNGAWDIASSSYATTSYTHSYFDNSSNANKGFAFSSDGTKMYIVSDVADMVFQYTLGTAWDVSTVVSSPLATSTPQATTPQDVAFSSDGTKMYVLNYATQIVYQYTLGTAWQATTSAYSSLSTSTSAFDTTPMGFAFSSDGTKMYVIGSSNDKVFQYTLGTAWNVSTASFSVSTSTLAQNTTVSGVQFSSDGTKMYVSGGTNDIYQYTLGTAWNVSTASYGKTFNKLLDIPEALYFSSNGTKMYYLNTPTRNIYQYELANPLINSVSGSASGFSGTPDNTDPFTSGQEVVYTVQSALPEGTYYWRAKAGDPNGTNEYGSWSSTRSFTISSGGGVSTPLYIEDVYFLQ